jgi:hypothetical protein
VEYRYWENRTPSRPPGTLRPSVKMLGRNQQSAEVVLQIHAFERWQRSASGRLTYDALGLTWCLVAADIW